MLNLLLFKTVPAGSWRSMWSMPAPVNLLGTFYRGVNFINLSFSPYKTPVWGTFQQVRQNGGYVKKGESASLVVFWKPMKEVDPDTGKETKHFLLRYYWVFNAEQCHFDELGQKKVLELCQKVKDNSITDTKKAQQIVADYHGPRIEHKKLIDSPYYSPPLDLVAMPLPEFFEKKDEYFHTLFHELTHSTGHKTRLNRPLEGLSRNKSEYSKEELVAELGASYLAEVAGLDFSIENSASYIKGWSDVLKDNISWIIWAASRAEKAANFILGTEAPSYIVPEDQEITQPEMAEEPLPAW